MWSNGRIFFLVGGIILAIGFLIIISGYIDSIYSEFEDPKRIPLQYETQIYKTGIPENPTTIQFKFIFNTDYEFAVGNPLEYTFQAKEGGPHILDKLIILFESPNINSTKLNPENIEKTLDYAFENDLAIELDRKGTTDDAKILYEKRGTYVYPFEIDVKLFPITLGKNGAYGDLNSTSTLFTIKPRSEFLNTKASVQQIIASKNQDISNKYIIGIAILGISAGPFTIATNYWKKKG